jgi:hypothetical protein
MLVSNVLVFMSIAVWFEGFERFEELLHVRCEFRIGLVDDITIGVGKAIALNPSARENPCFESIACHNSSSSVEYPLKYASVFAAEMIT